MKTLFKIVFWNIIFISAVIYSCTPSNTNSTKVEFNKTDTTGYYNARLLIGLGDFHINQSTFKDIYNLLYNNAKRDKRYIIALSPESYIDVYTYDTLKSLIKTDYSSKKQFGCPNIKKIELYEYYLGNIEINELSLLFYNEILIEISCNQNDDIEKGFMTKYGKDHFYKNDIWIVKNKKTTKRPSDDLLRDSKLIEINEKYYWHNENVLVESVTYLKYKYESQRQYYGSYFKISTKDDIVLKAKLECSNRALKCKEKLKLEEKKSDYDKL